MPKDDLGDRMKLYEQTETNLITTIRAALTYEGAPTCDHCSDPESMCQMYNDCDCPDTPSCHVVRARWMNQKREEALLALVELERELRGA